MTHTKKVREKTRGSRKDEVVDEVKCYEDVLVDSLKLWISEGAMDQGAIDRYDNQERQDEGFRYIYDKNFI